MGYRDTKTRAQRWEQLDEDLTYSATQLDRDVVTPSQIRTVIRTFRDRLFTDIYPGRTIVPKTLIFAKDDSHAESIVEIVREEFGKGNDFCQKITYKVSGKSPEEPDCRVPQLLQPAHRRDRGHDCHRHRRQAAGDSALHALGQVPAALRTDAGPGHARHQRQRPEHRHQATPAARTAS